MGRSVAKNFGLDFRDMDRLINKYKNLGVNLNPIIEEILEDTHEEITQRLKDVTVESNFPAGGKYSHGGTKDSIKADAEVHWVGGNTAYVPVGYDLTKSQTSIFLMYGTPKMRPAEGMYEAIFGRQTRTKLRKMQMQSFIELCEDALGE